MDVRAGAGRGRSPFKQRVGVPRQMLWLRWDPEPALAEHGEEEGARVAVAWLYAFNYPSAAQHGVAVKINQRKREVLAAPSLPAGTEQGAALGGEERDWQQG